MLLLTILYLYKALLFTVQDFEVIAVLDFQKEIFLEVLIIEN